MAQIIDLNLKAVTCKLRSIQWVPGITVLKKIMAKGNKQTKCTVSDAK